MFKPLGDGSSPFSKLIYQLVALFFFTFMGASASILFLLSKGL